MQFASPYVYGAWDPVNMVDPTGEYGWEAFFVAVYISAVFATVTYLETGDAGLALKQFGIGVAMAAVAGYAAPVANGANGGYGAVQIAANAALAGYSSYGIYQNVQSENYGAVAFAAVMLALQAYSLYQGYNGGVEPGTTDPSQRVNRAQSTEAYPESAPPPEVRAERGAAGVGAARASAAPGTEVVYKDVFVGKSGDRYTHFDSYERFLASGQSAIDGSFFPGSPGKSGFFGFRATPGTPARIEIYAGATLEISNLSVPLPSIAPLTRSFVGAGYARFVGGHEAAHSWGIDGQAAANRFSINHGY
jgi:hypothetical protein